MQVPACPLPGPTAESWPRWKARLLLRMQAPAGATTAPRPPLPRWWRYWRQTHRRSRSRPRPTGAPDGVAPVRSDADCHQRHDECAEPTRVDDFPRVDGAVWKQGKNQKASNQHRCDVPKLTAGNLRIHLPYQGRAPTSITGMALPARIAVAGALTAMAPTRYRAGSTIRLAAAARECRGRGQTARPSSTAPATSAAPPSSAPNPPEIATSASTTLPPKRVWAAAILPPARCRPVQQGRPRQRR